MAVSPDNIKIARFLAQSIGFDPDVHAYYDNDKKNKLDIINLTDPIDKEVAIFSTIGLSDYPNLVAAGNKNTQNIPVELLITGYKKYKSLPNILSTCAFYIMKDKYECRPGAVFMRMIEFYERELEMKHIYFTTPFLWQDKLEQLKTELKEVSFLLAIPISDQELKYKLDQGDDALETLFEENEIDIYNLHRKSII